MKRIEVQIENNTDPIAQAATYMVSAYKDEASRKIILIAVDMTDQAVSLPLSGLTLKNKNFTTYTTSREKNLAKSTAPDDKMQMEPKSVTTFEGYYH